MERIDDKEPGKASRKTGLIVAAIALAVVLVGAFLGYQALSQAGVLRNGGAAARQDGDVSLLAERNSTVYTAQGAPMRFSEIADGKPLVINFWATWCPYCIQEMDDYQSIYDEYGDDISFAFVDCVDGTRETVADGATWLDENGHDLPAYYDTDREAVRDFGAASLPTTAIVDAQGEILTISAGVIDPDLMRDALDSLVTRR